MKRLLEKTELQEVQQKIVKNEKIIIEDLDDDQEKLKRILD